jgi:hypothetical protein
MLKARSRARRAERRADPSTVSRARSYRPWSGLLPLDQRSGLPAHRAPRRRRERSGSTPRKRPRQRERLSQAASRGIVRDPIADLAAARGRPHHCRFPPTRGGFCASPPAPNLSGRCCTSGRLGRRQQTSRRRPTRAPARRTQWRRGRQLARRSWLAVASIATLVRALGASSTQHQRAVRLVGEPARSGCRSGADRARRVLGRVRETARHRAGHAWRWARSSACAAPAPSCRSPVRSPSRLAGQAWSPAPLRLAPGQGRRRRGNG